MQLSKTFILFILLIWLSPSAAHLSPSSINCPKDLFKQHPTINLPAVCPQTYQALNQQNLLNTLDVSLLTELSLRQLKLLQKAIHPQQTLALDDTILDELLADIYHPTQKDQSTDWWKQLVAWLNHSKPEQYEHEFYWLIDFFQAITPSQKTVRDVMYGLAAIIVLTLVALLTKWLLHRGAISTQQHNRSRKRESVVDAVNVSTTLSLSAIKQLPPKEQSVALLTSAIFHLKNKGHLPNNKALSNHQLNQHLQQHNLSLAADFSNLLTHVEPVIYGNITPSEPLLNDCWQSVTSLIKP